MRIIKKLVKNPLFHVSSLNTLSVMVRIAGGLVASKVVALFLGPGGLALIGNFRNFLTMLDSFSTVGFQNGIIKYVAESEKEEVRLYRILSTVFISILAVMLLISAILLLFSGFWSDRIFGEEQEYAWVFRVLAFSLPWYAGSIVFLAIINGLGKYKSVISINIWGNIIGVALSAVLIWKLNVAGAFLGLIITPALLFVFSFYLLQRQFPGFRFLRWKNFDASILKGLLSYSFMTLVSAMLAPVVYVAIRTTIMHRYGIEEAGFWEGMNRISSFYLMFVSTMLTVYFLPQLAMAKSAGETKSIFWSYYKSIVPLFIGGIVAVYFLRGFIVHLLFTPDFLPMKNLFFWQLLGDLFKVCSLILGYQFYAKKLTRAFITTEIMSVGVLYFSSLYFVSRYGAEGAVMAHAFTYFVYLAVLSVYFRKTLF